MKSPTLESVVKRSNRVVGELVVKSAVRLPISNPGTNVTPPPTSIKPPCGAGLRG